MPQKPQVQQQNTETQASRRFRDTFYDIHKSARFPAGRPFWGWREYAANANLGHQPGFVSADLMPGAYIENDDAASWASVWQAPWIPEARYFRFDYPKKLISFAYDVLARDEEHALTRYYEAAALLSAERGWGEIDPDKPMTFQVRAVIGRAPNMLKIARAAQAGDPWLLGHIDEPNEALARILDYKVIRFAGHEPNRAIGVPVVGRVPQPAAPMTPEQVLGTDPAALAKLVADIVNATMDAREQQKAQSRTQKARDARAANRPAPKAEPMSA